MLDRSKTDKHKKMYSIATRRQRGQSNSKNESSSSSRSVVAASVVVTDGALSGAEETVGREDRCSPLAAGMKFKRLECGAAADTLRSVSTRGDKCEAVFSSRFWSEEEEKEEKEDEEEEEEERGKGD